MRKATRKQSAYPFIGPFAPLRKPVKRIKRRSVDDINEPYLEWIRTLPCCFCEALGLIQRSPTQACHVGVRGLLQRCPDREALPGCGEHHDRGKPLSLHTLGKTFWDVHGLDKGVLIERYNRLFALESEWPKA